ncbi:MAG: FtsW/RodA/SpoVE family cell cycle protein [Parasporobacterium sp.]|nr:FtsW/RodA/SpoVE family cell cycle protein [Parasporobacterium sp.]
MNLKRIIDTLRTYDFRSLNFRLIIYTIALSVLGIMVIGSATDDPSYVKKQILGLVIGVVVMFVFALVKYEMIARYYWLLYIVNILILLMVTFFGVERSGAKRWIEIFNIQFQPSELSKLLLMIFISVLLARNVQSINSIKFILLTIGLFAVPLVLVLTQPDLSTSLVIISVFCAIMFVSPISGSLLKRIALVVGIGLAVLLTLIILLPADKNIIPKYQYNRLVGFYDPDNQIAADIRYQQENSVTAIAGGGVSGKGLNNSDITSVKNAEFISEPQTDFIFTIIGEELGFLGSVGTLILIGLIIWECIRIGMRAREKIGQSIAIGYATMLAVQSFINIGVTTMLLPNTGLTLPFVSAGLSSLITSFLGIGIILNIGLRKKISF